MKPLITFVNHASVIFSHGDVTLITDPWISGPAFNDSWELISQSKLQIDDFAKITHIWFSHERTFEIDTAGLTSPVLDRWDFTRIPRPSYPLDRDTRWRAIETG